MDKLTQVSETTAVHQLGKLAYHKPSVTLLGQMESLTGSMHPGDYDGATFKR